MSLATVATRTIAGRNFRCSEWTAGHLGATMARLAQEHPTCRLVILQPCFNVGVKASAGTHDFDGVLDVQIVGMAWDKAQSFLRASGWAAWHRTPAQGFGDHIHMATIPPGLSGRPTAEQVGRAYAKLGIKVGKYIDGGWTTSNPHAITATCQIVDYFAHTFGLANNHQPGADKSWFPSDIARYIYKPTAPAKEKPMPKPGAAPSAHTHLLNVWKNERSVDLRDVFAVMQVQREPWHSASWHLDKDLKAAFDKYIAATKEN